MIVTIHQPNFAPWLGYFDKIRKSDVFILLDTVPFTKGGFQNRVQIKGQHSAQWLTVPIVKAGRTGQSTNSVQINHSAPWRTNHLRTLQALYAKTRYFQKVSDELINIYSNDTDRLVEFNVPIIKWMLTKFQIDRKVIFASELNCLGSGTSLLLSLVQAVGGDTYLSGPSGRNYLELAKFESAGVAVDFHEFTSIEYQQLRPPFVPGLSALDYLFNVGIEPWYD
jgi:hypothetical protein